jgi:hypothetical protein
VLSACEEISKEQQPTTALLETLYLFQLRLDERCTTRIQTDSPQLQESYNAYTRIRKTCFGHQMKELSKHDNITQIACNDGQQFMKQVIHSFLFNELKAVKLTQQQYDAIKHLERCAGNIIEENNRVLFMRSITITISLINYIIVMIQSWKQQYIHLRWLHGLKQAINMIAHIAVQKTDLDSKTVWILLHDELTLYHEQFLQAYDELHCRNIDRVAWW